MTGVPQMWETLLQWYIVITALPCALALSVVSVLAMLQVPGYGPEEVKESAVAVITGLVNPWWLDPLVFMSGLPGLLGAILSLGFVVYLLRGGHLESN